MVHTLRYLGSTATGESIAFVNHTLFLLRRCSCKAKALSAKLTCRPARRDLDLVALHSLPIFLKQPISVLQMIENGQQEEGEGLAG